MFTSLGDLRSCQGSAKLGPTLTFPSIPVLLARIRGSPEPVLTAGAQSADWRHWYRSSVSQHAFSHRRAWIAPILLGFAGLLLPACGTTTTTAEPPLFPGISSIYLSGNRLWVATQFGGYHNRGEVMEVDSRTGSILRTWRSKRDDLWSPVGMVKADHALWVLNQYSGAMYNGNQTGSIVEIALSSGSVIRVIRGHGQALANPEGIAAYRGTVWVADNLDTGYQFNGGATELDATSGKILRVIGSRTYSFGEPQGLALARGVMWTANYQSNFGLVTAFRAGDGAPYRTATRPSDPYCSGTSVTSSQVAVWVTEQQCKVDGYGTIARIDPLTGAVDRTISVGTPAANSPTDIAVAGNSVWVLLQSGNAFGSTWGQLVLVNAATGQVNRESSAPKVNGTLGPGEHQLAATSTRVWVVDVSESGLIELDARTGKVIRRVS